jgi:hypothetical protein
MTIKDFYIFCCNQGGNSILVSGAGTTGVNGIYTYVDEFNNYPHYRKQDTFYEIYRSSSNINGTWVIVSEVTNLYETDIGVINPVGAIFTPVEGASPAPTLTLY